MAKPSFSRDLEGARILIVEDDSILAMNVEDRLKSEGCKMIGRVSRQSKALDVLDEAPRTPSCWISICVVS